VPLDDEVEPELEDRLLGGPGVGVRQGIPRGRELLEEAARDGHVHAGALRVEGTDPCAVGNRRHDRGGRDGDDGDGCDRERGGRASFGRPKYTGGVARRDLDGTGSDRPHGRDEELPHGRLLDRPKRRGDEGSVPGGLAEEPRQDLGRVLGRDDPRDLDDGGQAEIAAPEGGLDVGVLLDERGRGLAVLGSASG
jgi:hypothetical protein